MAIKRIRASRLESVGQVASEHAEVWRKLKQGKIDPPLASRMSAILVNHRSILETGSVEAKLTAMEERIADLLNNGPSSVIPFSRKA